MSGRGRRGGLGRLVYGLLLWMHPEQFRREFGPEMAWDFEDAVRDGKARTLYWDGVVSLGRQWMLLAVSAGTERRLAPASGLLSGRYAVIDVDRLTPFELLRGAIVSAALIAGLVMLPTRTVRSYVQPANAAGMRGQTAAGTRSMQRGGAGSGDAEAMGATVVRPAMQPATAADLIVVPTEVAAATAEALSGVPVRGQVRPGGVAAAGWVVDKPRFTEFDVVSVRENKSGGDPEMNFPLGPTDAYNKTGGMFRARNLSLPAYISFAYKLNTYQNSSMRMQVPEWARATRYDIEARVDGEPTKDEMRTMMRALLADRFKLKAHREMHEMAVMDLEMVKPGRTGAGLVPHAADDPECRQKAPTYFSPCGAMGITPAAVARMAGRNVTVGDFASFSLIPAGRPVVDKTGLTGRWDIVLDFVQDSPGRPADAPVEEAGPGFFEALKQQMGLRMVPARGMVETVVLDGVERPAQN